MTIEIKPAMTGAELKDIRNRLGLSTTQMGRALGYEGNDVTASGAVRKLESGERPIPVYLSRLATMLDLYEVPAEWIAGARAPQKRGRKSLADMIERVQAADNVLQLVDALRALEDFKQGASADVTIPQFLDYSQWPEVDWSDYADEAISADETHIAFREQDGTYSQTTWKKFLESMED